MGIAIIFTFMFVQTCRNGHRFRAYAVRYQLPLLLLAWAVPILRAINPGLNQKLDHPVFGVIFILLLVVFVGFMLAAKSKL